MAPDQAVLDACLDAYLASELPKTKEAIASEQPTAEDFDEKLTLATENAYHGIAATLFDAGFFVSALTVGFLLGLQQQPSVVNKFLENGFVLNAKISNSEPLL